MYVSFGYDNDFSWHAARIFYDFTARIFYDFTGLFQWTDCHAVAMVESCYGELLWLTEKVMRRIWSVLI